MVLCTCLSTNDVLCQSATRRSGPGGCCACLNKPCEAKKLQHTCSLSTSCSTSCLSRAAIVSFRARATLLVSSCSACILSCSRLELPVLGTAGNGSCNQQYVLTVLVSLLGCGIGENTAHVFCAGCTCHSPASCKCMMRTQVVAQRLRRRQNPPVRAPLLLRASDRSNSACFICNAQSKVL